MASLDSALAQLRNTGESSTSGNISKRIEQLEQTVRDLAGALMPPPDCAACQAPVRYVFDAPLSGQRPRTATERARIERGLCPDCGGERPAGQLVVHYRNETVEGALLSRGPLPRAMDTALLSEPPEVPVPPRMPAKVVQAPAPPVFDPPVSTSSATSQSHLWPCPTCGAGVVVHGQRCNDCMLAAVERRSHYSVPGPRRRW